MITADTARAISTGVDYPSEGTQEYISRTVQRRCEIVRGYGGPMRVKVLIGCREVAATVSWLESHGYSEIKVVDWLLNGEAIISFSWEDDAT